MSKNAPKSNLKKWIGRIVWLVFVFLLIIAITVLITVFVNAFTGKDNEIFGYRLIYILTDSMEPHLVPGNTILSKSVDAYDLAEGDFVTYIAPVGSPLQGKSVTHAVIRTPFEGEDGKMYILTKGTKQGAPTDAPVPVENVIARYVRTLTIISFIVKLLLNPWGYAIIIAAPLLGILIAQLIRMAKVHSESDMEKEEADTLKKEKEDELKALEEEIARQAVEEFIKNQQNNASATAISDTVDTGKLDTVDTEENSVTEKNSGTEKKSDVDTE